jgi:N-formylglutamate amidohydrolase
MSTTADLALAAPAMLDALQDAYITLDELSRNRLTPSLRTGRMTTTLGNVRAIVREAIVKAGAEPNEA